MALYPIRLLKDKNMVPFFPLNTLESVLVDGTDQNLKDILNNIYTKTEVNTMFAVELSKFSVYNSVSDLPATARDGAVAAVDDSDTYIMYLYYSGSWHTLTQKGDKGASFMYNWDGTKLGVKTDEEQNYTYVDLKGDTGAQGPQGPQGPQGEPGTGATITSIEVNGVTQPISNKTVDISVPTKVSQVQNDSGFVTKSVNDLENYPKTDEVFTYLGRVSQYDSDANALDITGLPVGLYALDFDVAPSNLALHFKGTWKDATIYYTYSMTYVTNYSSVDKRMYLRIFTVFNDDFPDPQNGNAFAEFLSDLEYQSGATYGHCTNQIKFVGYIGAPESSHFIMTETSRDKTYSYLTQDSQGITGKKTFNSCPASVANPSNSSDLTTKDYVDTAITTAIGTTLGGSY